MRRTVLALALLASLPACSWFRKAKLTDSTPTPTPAQASSPFGDWVLFTDPNKTAFAGAKRVELNLTPSTFRMVAVYPAGNQVVISGPASITPSGLLTLMPQTTTAMASGARPPIPTGQTIQVLASAADNTMVFAPPARHGDDAELDLASGGRRRVRQVSWSAPRGPRRRIRCSGSRVLALRPSERNTLRRLVPLGRHPVATIAGELLEVGGERRGNGGDEAAELTQRSRRVVHARRVTLVERDSARRPRPDGHGAIGSGERDAVAAEQRRGRIEHEHLDAVGELAKRGRGVPPLAREHDEPARAR